MTIHFRGRLLIKVAALAFLAVNLGMEALGWQVGGPGAEERATMLTVLFVSSLGAALAGGASISELWRVVRISHRSRDW